VSSRRKAKRFDGDEAVDAGSAALANPVIRASTLGDGPLQTSPAGPRAAALLVRFTEAADGLPRCQHIAADPGEPGFWQAREPEHVACLECLLTSGQGMTGTPADAACDWCGTSGTEIDIVHGEVSGVLVTIGLCPACCDADRTGRQV
jgi:hypothetical protein